MLDRRGAEAVLKAMDAKTWADAGCALADLDEYDRDPGDPFDVDAEWQFGVLYYAVAAQSAVREIIEQLPRPVLDLLVGRLVTVDFGLDCDRCYLQTDESPLERGPIGTK